MRDSSLALAAALLSFTTLWIAGSGCAPEKSTLPEPPDPAENTMHADSNDPAADETPPAADQPKATELATLATGCFWCTEAVLEQVAGIEDVASGYIGGSVDNPSYKAVCNGTTGHAEAVQLRFDPSVISYEAILEWFWNMHDPTTLNRQGNDVGTQYRSAIFYHSAAQREAAEKSKAAADASGRFDDPIVTEITEASTFWEAEGYHQDYYRQNKSQGYCRAIIAPKLDKLGLESR